MRGLLLLALTIAISSLVTAKEPLTIATGAGERQPQQPQVVIDGDGRIHVVYGVGHEIHYVSSGDGGKSFLQPSALPPVHAMSLGMRRGPRIAQAKGALCISAIGGKQGKGRDGDLMSFRSTDGGKTWLGPVVVNDVPDAAREGLHAMAAGPKGLLSCVWLDLRSGKTEVMCSCSTDGGETWEKNSVVYRSPDVSVCECCHPSVAIDDQDQINVMWRNALSGERDMYMSSSKDGGKTFNEAIKLGLGSWPLDACPMDGGAISISESREAVMVWRRDTAIYLTSEKALKEKALGNGEQPVLCVSQAGPWVVWLGKRGGELHCLKPHAKSSFVLAAKANDPVIAVAANGRGPVVVLWEERTDKQRAIKFQLFDE